MRVIPGIAQHVGDRESQQDAYGFSSFGDRAFESHGGVMMVLCDGMGGLANGAIASRSAVGAVLSGYSRKQPSEDIPSALERVVREAHQAVCAICAEGGTAGTTIVVAVICRDRLYWTWLGDSRLYLCRRGAPAEQLTEDHNVASLQRAEGALRDAAAATNPEALTAYLGAPYLPQSPTVRDRRLLPGDRIVACSDGLYRGLPPEAIASAAHRGQPMNAAEQMINAVLKQRLPHQDNVTVVLFELSSIHPLAIFVRAPSPTGAAVLSGSICLATGIVLGGVLNSFGVLKFPPANRPKAEAVTSPPAPPTIPPLNSASMAPTSPAPPPPTDHQPTDQHATDKPPADQHASDQHSADKPPTDQHASDQHPADKPPADQRASDQHPADKPATDQHASDQHPADEHPVDQHATDPRPTDQHATKQHAADQPPKDKLPSTYKPNP